jgi:hypothetical protein
LVIDFGHFSKRNLIRASEETLAMILLWDQLELHYGCEIHRYKSKFESAGETTYALLCCRFSPVDDRLSYSRDEHAEARLLESDDWKVHINRALANWTPRSSTIVVTMAVNRSPCRDCAVLLVDALEKLNRQFPVACENSRFILACRGLYVGRKYILGTRKNAFKRLKEAGWESCVLQLGKQLPASGRELLTEIQAVEGWGYARLR